MAIREKAKKMCIFIVRDNTLSKDTCWKPKRVVENYGQIKGVERNDGCITVSNNKGRGKIEWGDTHG